ARPAEAGSNDLDGHLISPGCWAIRPPRRVEVVHHSTGVLPPRPAAGIETPATGPALSRPHRGPIRIRSDPPPRPLRLGSGHPGPTSPRASPAQVAAWARCSLGG